MAALKVRVVACDYSSNAVGLYLAETGYVVPPARDESYVERIIEICRAEQIDIIMVGGIVEMQVLSNKKEYIKAQSGAYVVSSSPEALHVMEDKWELSQALCRAGFDYPRSVLPENRQGLKQLLDEYKFPYIVKDRLGAGGSTGVGVARDMKQLYYLIETIKNPVVQEYLHPDDQEYTVGAFIGADGRGKGSIVMIRQLGLGMTFKGQVLPGSPLGEYGERILEALGCEGPANLQLRLTERGPVVFEINPRFSSTTSARAHYGYNEPEMCIRSFVLREELKRPEITNGRFFRVIEDIFIKEHDFEEAHSKGIIRKPPTASLANK
jgi:carbamoyl-phosphate synthase large subunit